MSGAHIAEHAAAERQKQEQEEEEDMTRYHPEEIQGEWEFKIVRSATSQFKNPDVFQQVMAEEAMAGWQLLEKLDDSRIRFKRPISARKRDTMLPAEFDPYRTQYGISEGVIVFWVIAAIFLVIGTIILLSVLAEVGILNF